MPVEEHDSVMIQSFFEGSLQIILCNYEEKLVHKHVKMNHFMFIISINYPQL